MADLHGIDVSHYQGGLQLAAAGVDFAIFKATEGTGYVDSQCAQFYAQAQAAGVLRGLYHFYRGNAYDEATFFVENIGGWIGDAVLALDFEDPNYMHDVAGAKAWLDRVAALTGVKPVIYMNRSFLTGNDWRPVVDAGYGLWLARYGSGPGDISPWPVLTMWQYSDAEHDGGYVVDADRFYGDRSAWLALAGSEDNQQGEGFLMALSDAEQKEILDFVRDGGKTALNKYIKEIVHRSTQDLLAEPLEQGVGNVQRALEDTRVISRRTELDVESVAARVEAIADYIGVDAEDDKQGDA
jgi:GH25 family lysozyme M1 (1,4-beta-N-acetylmuramidase)